MVQLSELIKNSVCGVAVGGIGVIVAVAVGAGVSVAGIGVEGTGVGSGVRAAHDASNKTNQQCNEQRVSKVFHNYSYHSPLLVWVTF